MDDYEAKDKDTFMIANFGTKLVRFVASKKKGYRVPGQGAHAAKITRSLGMPFRPVIFADGQYAIFDDMSEFKVQTDETGLDLDHMKLALKTIAKLHAMSFAYFNNANVDIKDFAMALKLMIDPSFHPSASAEDKSQAKKKLETGFEHLMQVISGTPGGESLVEKARIKFKDRLYAIFKEAHATTNARKPVLCHGFPVQENFMFSYKREGNNVTQSFGQPVDAKLIKFREARFANAITDVQMLLCSSLGPKVEEKGDFLLRFVYHEALISSLKSLDIEPPESTDFNVIKEDFKKHQAYGMLAAAIHLAQNCRTGKSTNNGMSQQKSGGRRVFNSKILGGIVGQGDPKVYAVSGPAQRAKALIEKLVA